MAKTIDLTGKLGLGGKPTVKVGDVTLTVDDSARTMLRVLELVGDGEADAKAIVQACDLVFDKPSRKAIDAMNLSFEDFVAVVSAAMELVTGAGDEGNGETPATA